jgi:Family of unknown function (DUF6049)
MKRIGLTLFVAFLTFSALPSANADSTVIYLTSKSHQLFDGTFRNDELATDLLSSGRLGQALTQKRVGPRTWVIDGELLDEVADMADGYKLADQKEPTGQLTAKEWLSRLLLVTSGDQVIALPYGNPDIALVKRSAPSELRLYVAYGQERVAFNLNRKISTESGVEWSTGTSRLSPLLRKKYAQNRQALTTLTTVVKAPEVTAQRAKLGLLLSPSLDEVDRKFFSFNAGDGVAQTLSKLRVTSGKYQISSATGKVPVTFINSFNVPVKVNIKLTPLNSRVQVSDVSVLQLPANSRVQLAIPFTVIAPGATTVLAQITNMNDEPVGPSAKLAINITIFDSKVTWFTIGAALLLFVAAFTQTIRRIRKQRKPIIEEI